MRNRQKRMSSIAESCTEHSIIWGMFMATTFNAATFMGKNFSCFQGVVKNYESLFLKQMFDVTAQLVNNQEEINCLDKILYGKNSWTHLSLINDPSDHQSSKHKGPTYFTSDSVLCLGKVLQHPECNQAWKDRVAGVRAEKNYSDFDDIKGESAEFEWNIFPGFTTLQLWKAEVTCSWWRSQRRPNHFAAMCSTSWIAFTRKTNWVNFVRKQDLWRVVEVGQYFVKRDAGEFNQNSGLSRIHPSTRRQSFSTKRVTRELGLYWKSRPVFSTSNMELNFELSPWTQDDSHSWARISYGTVKYVIESIEYNTENLPDPQEEQVPQTSTSVVAARSKAKAKPQPEGTCWDDSNNTNTSKKMDWHWTIKTRSRFVRSLEESHQSSSIIRRYIEKRMEQLNFAR